MQTNTHFLDESTHSLIIGEMGQRRFADVPAAVKHFSFLAKSGKRFSEDDVVTIFAVVGLDTGPVPAALADLASRRVLESYEKEGTMVYYMERAARIEYGESIGRPTRSSGWNIL